MKKQSQLFMDNLISLMPGLNIRLNNKPKINEKAANTLFSIWKNNNNKISDNVYRKPDVIAINDIDDMVKEGLVEFRQDRIYVTEAGDKTIKVMILGDDRSVFEDDGGMISHGKALSNTKRASKTVAKIAKKHEDLWWSRFE